jgi:hypothetical protein
MKKIKGVFISPILKYQYTVDYCPYMYNRHFGKLLSIDISELQWKDKFRTPRLEEVPFISISLFNKFFFTWGWELPPHINVHYMIKEDYWEQVLWYLYYASYNKEKKGYDKLNIKKAKDTWPWTSEGKSTWNNKFLTNKSLNEIYKS